MNDETSKTTMKAIMKIDNHVPPPNLVPRGRFSQIAAVMDIGDSRHVDDENQALALTSAIYRAWGKCSSIKAPEEDGYRVWRIS